MSTDRFKLPDGGEEYCNCLGCWKRFHYTALDDDNLCASCRKDSEKEDDNFDLIP